MGTKQKVYTVIIVLTVVLLVLLVGTYSAIRSFLANDEFFGSTENFVTKVDSPLTLEEARKQLKFHLPEEATDIYYAHYHQMISYMFLVKFSAPLDVCTSHATDVIQRYNKNNPDRQMNLEFTTITGPPSSAGLYPILNVTWFDTHNIENGLMLGTMGPMQPMICIDTDRNIFYYSMID